MKSRTSTNKPTSTTPNMAPRIGQKTAHRHQGDGLAGQHTSSVGPETTAENQFPAHQLGEYRIMDPERAEDPNWLHNKLMRRKPAGGSENPGEKPDSFVGNFLQRQSDSEEKPDEEAAAAKLIQREEAPEEKPDEDTASAKFIQREEAPEEKPDEETAAAKLIQREEAPEEKQNEETVAGKLIQREEVPEEKPDEDTASAKFIQREEAPEEKPDEETASAKLIQREETPEEKPDKETASAKLIQREEATEEKPDEDTAAGKLIQREEATEEKSDDETAAGKLIQRMEATEEKSDDETAAGKLIQREEATEEKPDEETAAGKLIQREEATEEKPDEDTAATKLIQRKEATEEKPDEETAAGKLIQREEVTEEKPDEEVSQKPAAIQTKLKVGAPNDTHEQEADKKADEVMRMPDPLMQRMGQEESEEKVDEETVTGKLIQREDATEEKSDDETAAGKLIQRMEGPENKEEEVNPSPILLRAKSTQNDPRPVNEIAAGNIQTIRRGGGRPLSGSERAFFEPRFQRDFGKIRLHTDENAARASASVNARAFTLGRDVFFNRGEYNPGTDDGKKLMAHELTHTVQQGQTIHKKFQIQAKRTDPHTPWHSKVKSLTSGAVSIGSVISRLEAKVQRKMAPESQTEDEAITQEDEEKKREDETGAGGTAVGEQSVSTGREATTATDEATVAVAIPGREANKSGESEKKAGEEKSGDVKSEGNKNTDPESETVKPEVNKSQSNTPQEQKENGTPTQEQPSEKETGTKNESTEAKSSTETDPQDQNQGETDQGETGKQTSPSAGAAGNPAGALASLSGMMPLQMLNSIGGVEGAVGSHIGNERNHLKENPPTLERPAGSPQRKESEKPQTEAKEKDLPQKSKEIQEKHAPVAKEPAPLPPSKPISVESSLSPRIRGDESGKTSGDDVARLQNAVGQLPTTDPELKQDGGLAPAVALSEGADPARITEQSGKTGETIGEAHTKTQEEAAMPMGEEQLFPVVPRETLSAKIEGGGGASGSSGAKAGAGSPAAASGGAAKASAAGTGGADSIMEASSYIAQEESGKNLQASLNQAGSDLQAKDQERTQKVQEENKKLNQESEKLVEQNTKEQEQQRSEGQKQVASHKSDWNKEQGDLVRNADGEKAKLRTEGNREIATTKSAGDREANRHIQEGNRSAAQARQEAESTAAREKAKAKKQESGFFGWVASKVESFFDGIKAAIQGAFEKARALVRSAIEGAKKLAAAAIEKAQSLATAIVQRVGKAIIAIGDFVLSAFPKLRQKFRNAIQSAVNLAQKAINTLADTLKKGVQKLLDLAGNAINAVLSYAEKGMLAIVDTYKKAVVGAINAAKAFVDGVAMFAALIKDVAVDPLGWLGKLGTSAVDGIRNHLWNAFQTAVKEWFNQKLESVLGMGKAVWEMIRKGGITLAQIGQMAWNALKSMIPPALISILIEKLVSLIVPAAGAVKLIIEGLVAAWGSVQRILAAFEKFFAFLMTVKTGQAGKKFADAIAAAAVAVIDFVANWLLMKLGKGLLKAGKKIAQWVRKKFRGMKAGLKKRKRRKGKEKDKKKQERIDRARRELPPKISALLAKKPSWLRLKAQLTIWKINYRMRSLKAHGEETVSIVGVINPRINLGKGWSFRDAHLMRLVKEVAEEFVLVGPEDPNRKADGVESEDELATKDLTGEVHLPEVSYGKAKWKLSEDAMTSHRGTRESIKYGSSRAIVESGKERGLRYPTIVKRLRGVDAGPYLEWLFTGGPKPDNGLTKEQKDAADVLYSLFLKESSHPKGTGKHGRDLLYGAMITQLATTTDPKSKMSVSEGLGHFPAGFHGAQAGAKTVTNKLKKPEFKEFRVRGLGKDARKRQRREAELLEKWGRMHLPKWQKIYPNGKPKDGEMKELIRKTLMPLLKRFRRSGNDE